MATASTIEPCKFFARGGCEFGACCRFAHVAATGASKVQETSLKPEKRWDPEDGQMKTFEELEACYRGQYVAAEIQAYWCEECMPVPSSSKSTASPEVFKVVCRYFLAGKCAFGSQCQYLHESAQASKEAVDRECGICLENPKSKGSRLGLLENCDCVFCLQCIRSWRKQREQDKQNLRMCPLCRNESGFVVPCDRLILDPGEKAAEIESYREEMRKIPCKIFDYGKGTCPFGASCFYAHLNPDGTRHVPAPPRFMIGADGKSHVIKGQKLSDLFA